MEETVQVLFDEGALVRDGAVKLTRSLNALKIPPTVQGILAARIDRLPSDAKDLLQTLAVIGREFPLSLIRAVVAKPDDELNRLLSDLQLGEFIYEQPAVGDTEYIFKHALTQEVAYNSVLIERRKQMHERCGEAHRDRSSRAAGRPSDANWRITTAAAATCAKAVEYLQLAAQQALQRSAYARSDRSTSRQRSSCSGACLTPANAPSRVSAAVALGPRCNRSRASAAPEVERGIPRTRFMPTDG